MFWSCNKSVNKADLLTSFELNSESVHIINQNKDIFEAFKSMNQEESRSAFNTLTTAEMEALWLSNLKEFSENRKFTREQISSLRLFEEIMSNIDNYSDLKSVEEIWLEQSSPYFTRYEVFSLAYTINKISNEDFEKVKPSKIIAKDISIPIGTPGCNCSISSIFGCIGGTVGSCHSTRCTGGYGCGFEFLFRCGGMCRP